MNEETREATEQKTEEAQIGLQKVYLKDAIV